MPQRKWRLALASAAAIAVAACGADLAGSLTGNSVTGYEASSAFGPTGHSVSALGKNRVRVTATGSAATPPARVEKIALARAAEYGADAGHKFFKADQPQHSVRCGKRQTSERGNIVKLPAKGYAVVDVDVTYASAATDPTFRPTKDTADALKAELAGEAVAPDTAAKAAVEQQCGI